MLKVSVGHDRFIRSRRSKIDHLVRWVRGVYVTSTLHDIVTTLGNSIDNMSLFQFSIGPYGSQDYRLIGDRPFIGIDNYLSVLKDPGFGKFSEYDRDRRRKFYHQLLAPLILALSLNEVASAWFKNDPDDRLFTSFILLGCRRRNVDSTAVSGYGHREPNHSALWRSAGRVPVFGPLCPLRHDPNFWLERNGVYLHYVPGRHRKHQSIAV